MVTRPTLTMAHVLGSFAKWTAILAVFGLSLTLSITFFTQIAPPDKPWFPLAGVSLTEGGFILWMVVFMLTHHETVSKTIALTMVVLSAACSLMTAGYELYQLLAAHFDLQQNAQIAQIIAVILVLIFGCHFAAFVIDLFASYFNRPGHAFRGAQPKQESYHEDVRTTQVMQVAGEHPKLLPGSSTSEQVHQDVRTTQKSTKAPGVIKRYLSGQPLTGAHGRDCMCSSCRPDLHPVVRTSQETQA